MWLPPHRRALDGIGWVAQEREIFPSLSVEENLTVAARPGRWDLKAAYELFPRLNERRLSRGNHLSGGEQQMLATARALMTNPALLLLDEPCAGLSSGESREMAAFLKRLDPGLAILLIEHDMDVVFDVVGRISVLHFGQVVEQGSAAAIRASARVQEIYLGAG